MVRTVQEPQNTPGRPRLSWGATTSLVRSPSSSQASKAGGTPMLSSSKASSSLQATTSTRPKAILGERSENIPQHQRQTPSQKISNTLKTSRTNDTRSAGSSATTAARATPYTIADSSQMIQMPRTPLVGASPIRRKFQTTPHPRFSLPNIEVDENQTMLLDMDLSDLARGESGFDTESEADDVPVHRPAGRAVRGGVHMTPEPSQETQASSGGTYAEYLLTPQAAASSPPQSTPRAKKQPSPAQASARLPTPPSSQSGSFASPARLVASRTRPRPQNTPPRRSPSETSTPAAVSDPSPNPRQKKSARLSEMPSISTLRKSVTPIDRVQVVLTPRASLPKSSANKATAKAGPGPSTLSQQLAHSPPASTPKASKSTRLPPATAPAASRKPRASQASASQRLTSSQKRFKPRATQVSPKTRRKSTGTRRTSLESAKRGRKSVAPSALKGIKLGVGKKVVPAEPGEDPLLLVGWEADCSIWVPGNDEDEDEEADDGDNDEGDMIPPELRQPVAAAARQAIVRSPPRTPPPEKEQDAPVQPVNADDEPQWVFQDDYGFGSDSDGDDADVGNDTFFHVAARRAEHQEESAAPTPSTPAEETPEVTEPVRPSTPLERSTTPVASPVVRPTTPVQSPLVGARSITPETELVVEQEEQQTEEAPAIPAVTTLAERDLEGENQSDELQVGIDVPAAEPQPAEEDVVSPIEQRNERVAEAKQDESFTLEHVQSAAHSEDEEIINSVEEKQSVIEEPSDQPACAVVEEEDWPKTPEEPNMLDLLMSIPFSSPAAITATLPSPPTNTIGLPATPPSPHPVPMLPPLSDVEAQETTPTASAIAQDIATDDGPRDDEVSSTDPASHTFPQLARLAQSPLARELSFSDSESEEEATASCDVTAEAVSADWEVSVADTAVAEDSFVAEDRSASTDGDEVADHGVSVISTEEKELVFAPLSPKQEELVDTPLSPGPIQDQRARSQTLSPRVFARPRPSLFTLPAPASVALERRTVASEPTPAEDESDRSVVGDAHGDSVSRGDQQEPADGYENEEESITDLRAEIDSAGRDHLASLKSVADDADDRIIDFDNQETSVEEVAGDDQDGSVNESYEEEEPIECGPQPVEPNAVVGSLESAPEALVDEADGEVDAPQLDKNETLKEEEASDEISNPEEDSTSDVSRSSSPGASDDGSDGGSEEEEKKDEQSVVLEPGKIILSVRMLGTVKVETPEPEVPRTPTRHAREISAAATPSQTRTTERVHASPARPSTPVYPRLDTLPVAQPENVSTTPTMTPPRRHTRAAATPAESPSRHSAQDAQQPIANIGTRAEQAPAVRTPLPAHKPSKLSKVIEMSPDTTAPASPVSDTHAESISATKGHPLTESSLRLLDSVQVVPAGRNLLEEMADAEPGDTSINSIVEVSSMDPRAAARAAAILKLNHAYIEHGVLPDRVNATPKRTPRRKSLHTSSRFESIEAARGLSKDELLHEAELEIVSTHRGRSRSMSVFSTMTAATSATELPIPGGWVRTPKRKRSRPAHADRAHPTEERLAAAEAQAASSGSGNRPWGVPEWKKLEKVFRCEREVWIQEREVKGMPGGLIGWAKRVSIGPSRVVQWDPARVVDRFLREENAADLSGEWSRSVIELRVAALERRVKDKETSRSDGDEGEASPAKKARRSETATTPATPRAVASAQANIEPPSTIKRMLGFFWGGGSTTASGTQASGGKAPVLPVTADRVQNESLVTTQAKSRPSAHARPSAISRPPLAAYSSTPTQAPRAPTGLPSRATMLTSSFASTSMSSSTYSNTTLATPAANLYQRASEVSLSQRKAALQSLFSARHPLSDSTGSTASIRSQVEEDRSFARSRERGSFGSVKDVIRSFEEGGTLDRVMKGKSQAQAVARFQEPRLA